MLEVFNHGKGYPRDLRNDKKQELLNKRHIPALLLAVVLLAVHQPHVVTLNVNALTVSFHRLFVERIRPVSYFARQDIQLASPFEAVSPLVLLLGHDRD
jgi:hypothetical protein